MKKILLFLMILLLGIFWAQTYSFAQTCPVGGACYNGQCGYSVGPNPQCGPASVCGSDACNNFCITAPVLSCPQGYSCVGDLCVGAPPGTPANDPNNPPSFLVPSSLFNGSAFTNDPINIFSGESNFSSNDFDLKAEGPKLALYRRYRSLSTINGVFGYGWRTDFDINLTVDSYGDVKIFDKNGTETYFMNNNPQGFIGAPQSASYSPSPGNFSTLIQNADGTYAVTDKHGIATHYDINGRLSTRTDRNGNILSFVYNPSLPGGTYIQDASGRQIKLYFDSNGHVISAVEPVYKTYKYGYDTNGNLVSVTDPTGAVSNYTYDSNHKIIQFTNANGHNSYYQYDSQGRAVMNWRDNNVNKVTLNFETNNTTVVTDSLGKNTTYIFNDPGGFGLLTSLTDPLGAVTRQTWDGNMDRTSITDARNNVTRFSYDGQGNLIYITDPLGKLTTMTYTSDFDLINSITNALGNATGFTYDSKGNLTAITDALGNNHSFAYDQYGNVVTVTDSRGNSTNYAYDAFGNVLKKTDALGDNTNYTYE